MRGYEDYDGFDGVQVVYDPPSRGETAEAVGGVGAFGTILGAVALGVDIKTHAFDSLPLPYPARLAIEGVVTGASLLLLLTASAVAESESRRS